MDHELMRVMLEVDEHHWWYRGRRRIIGAELEHLSLPARAAILDAGCGSGRTMQDLVRFGTVQGLELDPDAAAVARDRGYGEVHIGRLEELPWPEDSFDLITCLDVIEHTVDDRVALRELRRVARPGATLLATVPAYQALWSHHDEINHHFRRYNRAMLRAAASEAGWQVQRMTSFNSLLLAPAAVVRVAQRRQTRNGASANANLTLGPTWLNGVLEQPLALEARWLASGRTLPAGLSLLTVLRNPPAA